MKRARHLAWMLALGAGAGMTLAAVESAAREASPIILAGQEKFFTDTLCDGEPALPAGCRCDGVKIDRTFVTVLYACPGEPVATFELRHPSDVDVDAAATRVGEIAVVPRGEAPAALRSAVEARVEAHEKQWKWAPASAGAPRPDDLTRAPAPSARYAASSRRRAFTVFAVVALALGAVAGVLWIVASRARRRGGKGGAA